MDSRSDPGEWQLNGPFEGLAMGIERMHTAKYWRMRAEEFRTKADCCEFPQTRNTLRQVANNYEQLARSVEQIVTVTELDERTSEARRVAREYADDRRAIMRQQRHRMT